MGIDKDQLSQLLNDNNFEIIELSLGEPNIFRSLSIEKAELRHSSFLAYLLNPNESHGLGPAFLRRILRDIFSDEKCAGRDPFDVDYIDFASVEVLREWKNIDILLKLPEDVVIIENKISSEDHSDQLSRYQKISEEYFPAHRRHFVYLTPFGSEPKEKDAERTYVLYSYATVAENLNTISKLYASRIPQKIGHMINDYVKVINLEITMNDELNDMALKLYKAHKDALDFIFENRPDASSMLYPVFENALRNRGFVIGSKNKGYIRFTTEQLDRLIPKTGEGWPDKEQFLFEIDYFWSNNALNVKAVVAPGDNAMATRILDAAAAIEDQRLYKKPQGKKWQVFYIKKISSFDPESLINEDESKIRERIDGIIDRVQPDIEKIANTIKLAFE